MHPGFDPAGDPLQKPLGADLSYVHGEHSRSRITRGCSVAGGFDGRSAAGVAGGAVTSRRSEEQRRQEKKAGEEAIGYAHEIKTYALRKLGEMLKATERAKGTRGQFIGRAKTEPPIDNALTLADLGIDKKISSLAPKEYQ